MNIVPFVAGIVFGCLGGYILFDYYRFNKKSIKTYGKILRYDEYQTKHNNRKCTMYRPSFEYSVNGNNYEVKSKVSFSSKVVPVGQVAKVLYEIGDESNARLAKGNGYALGVLFIGLSVPGVYLGLNV